MGRMHVLSALPFHPVHLGMFFLTLRNHLFGWYHFEVICFQLRRCITREFGRFPIGLGLN